ncbi:MAG: hypothetical protein LBV30_04390 [Propionibacteriaceae bacterium]|jgi:hypothetical protein|nr:hypothetical protein [Propionibacteriaceae bacterium]
MEWFIAVLLIVVLALGAVAASGRLGQFGGRDGSDDLSAEPLTDDAASLVAAIDQARFRISATGYNVDDVDRFLEALSVRLASPDRRLVESSGIMDLEQTSDRRV